MMLIIRLGVILMFIASIAAGSLSLLNSKTSPIIAENKAIEQEIARKEVVHRIGGTQFEKVENDGLEYYLASDDTGKLVGYVTIAYGKGYSSTIETVTGFDTDLNISGLKITFQQETPGLGTKAEEVNKGERTPWFLAKFEDKDGRTVAVVQDRGDIDSITGATITSRAIAKSINVAAAAIEKAESGRAAEAPESVEEDPASEGDEPEEENS